MPGRYPWYAGWIASLAIIAGCSSSEPARSATPATQPVRLAADIPAGRSRSFIIRYTATISSIPAGAHRLDLWLPVPSSDAQQTIASVEVNASLGHKFESESEYGNRVLHLWSDHPAAAAATISFVCTRGEESALSPGVETNVSRKPLPVPRLLEADRLGVINDRVRALAATITRGRADTLGKARAIYDYVLNHMAYDKKTPGWGNGDTLRACDVRKGNCTDFHALFISLARASGIPARFGIGVQVPAGQTSGTIAGYHCWAEFWLADKGWVPVDASEAWNHTERREFYFGDLDADRVRLSIGRDLKLTGMHGQTLNYFLAPYAEVDRNPVPAERTVRFAPVRTRNTLEE
jgi:transglutaminase-like putative cysteine protease